MKGPIKATRAELIARLDRQPSNVRAIAEDVASGLAAAQIGARPHPKVVERLIEDVEKLDRAIKMEATTS